MNSIIEFFKTGVDTVIAAPILFVTISSALVVLTYLLVAWQRSGRIKNLKAENLKLERRVQKLEQGTPSPAKTLNQSSDPVTPVEPPEHTEATYKLYLQRQQIDWTPYNEGVVRRFWAAGTALVGVVEQDLIARYKSQGIEDIRVILPDTELDKIAHHQLRQFKLQPVTNPALNQVDVARDTHSKLSKHLINPAGRDAGSYLRKYTGIMYSNITIFDDDAFLCPYNSAGVGVSNPTLHLNFRTNPEGYRFIEDEFLRMWDAGPSFGLLPRKGGGCSMIFINSSGCVLLYLRDKKPGIPQPGKWNLPGGYIDEDESPEDCITRELFEKIEYSLSNPKLFHVFNMPDRLEFTYSCTEDLEISNMPLHEGQRLRWFTADEIHDLPANQVAFGFKPVIQFFLKEWQSSNINAVSPLGGPAAGL